MVRRQVHPAHPGVGEDGNHVRMRFRRAVGDREELDEYEDCFVLT